jgi:hypothetical protein
MYLAKVCLDQAKKGKKLKEKYDRLKPEYEHKLATNFAQQITQVKSAFEQENVHLMSQALSSRSAKALQTMIKQGMETQFNRMAQELSGKLDENVGATLIDTTLGLTEKVWDSLQQLKEKQEDSPYLIPKNCRIAYTKGNRTVIIIEQEPQMRTVGFTQSLLHDDEKREAISSGGGIYKFNLAFPYVYFFVIFDNGKFNGLEIYFRNKALTSSKDHLCFAPLPNIRNDQDQIGRYIGTMCLGGSFHNKGGDFATVCEYIVSYFWQTHFSPDLGLYGCNRKDTLDPRIKSYATWQSESQENPLFILEIPWPNHLTVKGLLELTLDRRGSHGLNNLETHTKEMLAKGIDKITKQIQKTIKEVQKTKPRISDDEIKENLEKVVYDHTKLVFDACQKSTRK